MSQRNRQQNFHEPPETKYLTSHHVLRAPVFRRLWRIHVAHRLHRDQRRKPGHQDRPRLLLASLKGKLCVRPRNRRTLPRRVLAPRTPRRQLITITQNNPPTRRGSLVVICLIPHYSSRSSIRALLRVHTRTMIVIPRNLIILLVPRR